MVTVKGFNFEIKTQIQEFRVVVFLWAFIWQVSTAQGQLRENTVPLPPGYGRTEGKFNHGPEHGESKVTWEQLVVSGRNRRISLA